MEILAEIGKLTARYESRQPKDPFRDTPQVWRNGPDDEHTPVTHVKQLVPDQGRSTSGIEDKFRNSSGRKWQ
jgi:hypothetical protein